MSGTQVIDANYILSLIGDRVSSDKGVLTVDTETLRIIHQQIQKLSDMGEHDQAVLLKEFVDTELVKGNLSSNDRFDALFEDWKQAKVEKEINEFAKDWGIDGEILSDSLKQFSLNRKNQIPYIDDLRKSIDYKNARKPEKNPLEHNMHFITEALPEYMVEIKQKYE